MASIDGWYSGMTTQDLRDEAERAEREAAHWDEERRKRDADRAERDALILRIEKAKRAAVDPAL
jgi:hypothetical protein